MMRGGSGFLSLGKANYRAVRSSSALGATHKRAPNAQTNLTQRHLARAKTAPGRQVAEVRAGPLQLRHKLLNRAMIVVSGNTTHTMCQVRGVTVCRSF